MIRKEERAEARGGCRVEGAILFCYKSLKLDTVETGDNEWSWERIGSNETWGD